MDPEQRQQFHELRRLCALGKVEEVRSLLASGVDPNPAPGATGDDAAPPLDIVVSLDDPGNRLARLLLDAGADPNRIADHHGAHPPLHTAVARGKIELVRMLLDAGADPLATDHSGWRMPWHWAEYQPEIRALLVERGGGVSVETLEVDELEHLIKASRPLDEMESGRFQPLENVERFESLRDHPRALELVVLALIYDRVGYASSLLESGFPVRRDGASPLMNLAAERGLVGFVRKLLKMGVAPDESDNMETPLGFAMSPRILTRDHVATSLLLIEAGHDLEARNEFGDWLRAKARRGGLTTLVDRLPPMPFEIPVDPGAAGIGNIRIDGPDFEGRPSFANYRPNDPAFPLTIIVDYGRDEYGGVTLRAPGFDHRRERPWSAARSTLAEFRYGFLEPLVASWDRSAPMPIPDLLALLDDKGDCYEITRFNHAA